MRITVNHEEAKRVYGKLRDSLAQEKREGIHASDLMNPRMSYWKKVDPRPATEEEIGWWMAGRAHHYFMVAALTGVEDHQEASLQDPETGLYFSPDLVSLKGEFKTSRRQTLPKDEKDAKTVFQHYIKQCRVYATKMKTLSWKLYVFFLGVREAVRSVPRFKVYDLLFTKRELANTEKMIADTVAALNTALKKKDHTGLPLCDAWMCYRLETVKRNGVIVASKKIPVCPYWDQCKPEGRWTDVTE